jgi:hypothetical protein
MRDLFDSSISSSIMLLLATGRSVDDVERLLEMQALQLLSKMSRWGDVLDQAASHDAIHRDLITASQLHHRNFGPWFAAVQKHFNEVLLKSDVVREESERILRSAMPFPPV